MFALCVVVVVVCRVSGGGRRELTTKMRSYQVAEMTNELAPRRRMGMGRGRESKVDNAMGGLWRDTKISLSQSMIQKQVFAGVNR